MSDVAPNLLGTAAIQMIGVFTAVVVARIYSPAGRGEIAAAVSWLLLLSAIADIGISQAVPFYASRARVGTARSAQLVCVCSTLTFLPVLLFLPRAVGFDLSPSAFAYAAGGVFFSLSVNYVGGIFQGQGRSTASTIIRLYSNLPYVLAVVLVAIKDGSPDDLLLHAFAFSALSWAILLAWAFGAGHMAGTASSPLAREMSQYGLRTYAGNLAWIGSQRIPPLVIGAQAGEAALGLFAVAQSMAILPFVVGSSFALVVHGRVGSADLERRSHVARSTLIGGTIATSAATLLTLPLVFLGTEFAFGVQYAQATSAAAVLTVASGLFGVNFLLTALLRAFDRPSLPSWAELIGLLVNLIVGTAAAAQWGLMGSSLVIVISATLVNVTLAVMIRPHLSRRRSLEMSI